MAQYSDNWLWCSAEKAEPPRSDTSLPDTGAYDRAVELYRAERWEEACALFRKLVESGITVWQSQLGVGFSLLELGRHQEALEQFDICLRSDGNNEKALFGRAVALQFLGRHREAHALYIDLVSTNRDNAELLRNLISTCPEDDSSRDEFCRRLREIESESTDAMAALAGKALASDDYDSASRLLGDVVQQRPDWREAWFNLGVALQRSGRNSEGMEAYRRAIQVSPGFYEAWANLGAALHVAGDLAGAIEAYQHAASITPNSSEPVCNQAEAWFSLGRMNFQDHDFTGAARAFNAGAELMPSPIAYTNAGIAHHLAGDAYEATASFERALQMDPAYPKALRGLTAVAAEESNVWRAMECWQQLTAHGAVDADLAFNLGVLMQEQGDDYRAAQFYDAAVKAEPAFLEALINLGHALKRQGHDDEAEKHWAAAERCTTA